jgi:hypothetical protein
MFDHLRGQRRGAMLVCYALEGRSTWFVFAFGLACFGASTCGWQRARATDGAISDEKRHQERTSEGRLPALTAS